MNLVDLGKASLAGDGLDRFNRLNISKTSAIQCISVYPL